MTVRIVTGARGFIGRALTRRALDSGIRVISAGRRPLAQTVPHLRFTLEGGFEDPVPAVDVLIHLAGTTADVVDEEVEWRGGASVLRAATEMGATVLFVSSQAAAESAPTAYGRAKWRVEQSVLAAGGWVVRPGLVYGYPPGGLFARLDGFARRHRFVPALLPRPRVQPVHVDDLVEAIVRLTNRPDLRGSCLPIAGEPVAFDDFLRMLAVRRHGRRPLFVPLPAALVQAVLPRARAGRIASLRALVPVDAAHPLAALSLSLRSLETGLRDPQRMRRRGLVREASVLLRYVLGQAAPASLLRRYVRALAVLGHQEPVRLPSLVYRHASWLAAVDSSPLLAAAGATELGWRIRTSFAIAEASPLGARSIAPPNSSTLQASATIVSAIAAEAFWRLVRIVAGRWLKQTLRADATV